MPRDGNKIISELWPQVHNCVSERACSNCELLFSFQSAQCDWVRSYSNDCLFTGRMTGWICEVFPPPHYIVSSNNPLQPTPPGSPISLNQAPRISIHTSSPLFFSRPSPHKVLYLLYTVLIVPSNFLPALSCTVSKYIIKKYYNVRSNIEFRTRICFYYSLW